MQAAAALRMSLRLSRVCSGLTTPRALSSAAAERAVARALRMVSTHLKSAAEVEKKLLDEQHSAEASSAAVAKLQAAGVINDAELASSLARLKWRVSHYGRTRVKLALSQRLLSAEATEAALDGLFGPGGEAAAPAEREDGEEAGETFLFAAARKRWRASAALPTEARERRLVGWLARRGHSWPDVRDVVQKLKDESYRIEE